MVKQKVSIIYIRSLTYEALLNEKGMTKGNKKQERSWHCLYQLLWKPANWLDGDGTKTITQILLPSAL